MRPIGLIIAREREAKGWTQGQLATYSGLSQSYISRIEAGIHENISAKNIGEIARSLGLTPNYLYEQAGWYEAHNPALPPEVLELAEVIEAYPDGAAKEQAKRMIVDVAHMLRSLRGAEENEPAREGQPDIRSGIGGDR